MDEKQFEILVGKIDMALRLLALNLVKETKGGKRVEILSSAGLGGAEIAEMLGMKQDAVRQALHRLRRKGKRPSKKPFAEPGTEHGEQGIEKMSTSRKAKKARGD